VGDNCSLVRICIPTHNAGETLRETLASILAQTYTKLDIVIVDNASTDNTIEIAKSFGDPRVSVLRNTENIGAERNFTRCIDNSAGAYTAIFHADDIYTPQMVEKQVAFLERHPDAGAVFVNATLIDSGGREVGRYGIDSAYQSDDNLYDFRTIMKMIVRHSNFLICPSAMVRTPVYLNDIVEWRGSAFKTSADLDVWLRILQKHRIGILPEPLIRYRISFSQGSALQRARINRADFFLVLDHYLRHPLVKSFLTSDDLRYVARLERTDRIVRAVNLYLRDDPQRARELCCGLLNHDSLSAAWKSFRGAATLAVGLLVRVMVALRYRPLGKFLLLRMKRLANK
jgi:glycosyltransferase involved in cell wall biosynthesis